MNAKNFQTLQLKPMMYDILQELNFHHPTPIQAKVIPAILKGEAIVAQSHTGSGKTHSYLIPLMNELKEGKQNVQTVITAPTRELAMQIYDEVRKMIHFANKEQEWRARLLIGGTDKQKMAEKLKDQPQIVVGTPGRILDLVKEQALNVYTSTSIVIDEADLLIDLGLIEEVDQILTRMKSDVQFMVFSATFPEKLRHFLKKYMDSPTFITIDDQGPAPEKMEHRLIPLRHRSRADLILDASKLMNPYLALIFVNKKTYADELASELISKGLDVGLIHGGLTPRERKRTLKAVKDLKYQYIVATDLAARGIDIPGVSHVFNAELPKDPEFYIHRVGRTARAGLEGTAISFYDEYDLPLIEKLEKKGIAFENYDIRKGEWEVIQDRNQRRTRQKTDVNIEQEARQSVRKPKKVKPGYKKKMNREVEDKKRKLKREQKQNYYRKKK
ncbi:DEAD/DEAH box helicase [Salirhabdus salicampi]|uniref:DEAD/DEAH box helicase n=1 Tax=Salirhabdus salicampi TaxID=476102 RepID=UPI0020C449EF|nr:DEAD/DEAH box helicase [Salirhabdus salicampi]MCP8616885.1 DEAD/DEAH box helicase [Salirhabdus salicampi]